MANETKKRSAPRPKAEKKRRQPPRKQKQKRVRRKLYNEFKPDAALVSPFKSIRFTHQQRLELAKWLLYLAVCTLCLIVQDSIMSRVRFYGATTDLAVGAILLITVIEGSEVGSIFALAASTLYYFTGSAPGPYTVGALTLLGMAATLFRQQMWHRSAGSIIFCAALAMEAYEIVIYGFGIFLGLTRWTRIFAFLFTGASTALIMIPLYFLLNRIGKIGGTTWKE